MVPSSVETGDFSLQQSLHWGVVLETTNNNVDVKVIELVSQWRKKEGVQGSGVGLTMRQVQYPVITSR